MFLLKTKLAALVAGIALLSVSLQMAAAQSKAGKIDALMKQYNDYGQFNGSVLVAQQGKVVFKKGFGMADFEWKIPNTPDTKFRLGSITKQFTSMLILQLVQEGKLKLDGKITDYLPDYPKKTGEKITIHHLLTHTSGIPGYTEFPGFFRNISRDPYTPAEFVKLFADSALLFEPGVRWSYSNSAYFLLGVIIEKITGKPYEQVLQERIFEPLGMKGSGYDHHETILAKRAAGYERGPNGFVNASYLDMSIPYSAGSLYSTVEDLFLWDQALHTDKILSKRFKALLFKSYATAFGVMSYGYGWMMGNLPVGRSSDSVSVIQHGGGINGFNTLLCRLPGDRGLVVLLNNTGGTRLGEMNRAILGILYDKPYDQAKKSLAEALADAIAKNGLNPALERYRDLRKSNEYAVRENEMNIAGYQMLRMGKVKEAIEVFKLNVEEFPQSSNVYDSLGEAYMTDGNTELAIKNYEKSVELDSTNVNGIEVLKKLKGK
jgi:CubicO group peptidase (beta-lactamase class C family)